MSWYAPLETIQSKGSQTDRPGSLAGLYAAREIHEGQFFTNQALASFCWRLITFVDDRAFKTGISLFKPMSERRLTLWDNSIGSGRLIQFADPTRHAIFGCDVDGELVAVLSQTLIKAGFTTDIENCSMTDVRASGMNVAVINPPFSLTFDSPHVLPFPANSYGRFGPQSSAISHQYALDQALDCSDVVIAILPSSFALQYVKSVDVSQRLAAVYNLPKNLFSSEGTAVDVALLAFDSSPIESGYKTIDIASLDAPLEDIGLSIKQFHQTRLNRVTFDPTKPTITLPVTGEKNVRIVHNGRRIHLQFACGLMQAKVMNRLFERAASELKPEGNRLPKGVKYNGQGLLDVEMHAVQPDPIASLLRLTTIVSDCGGDADVDASLLGYLKRRVREYFVEMTPLRHVVQGVNPAQAKTITGRAKISHVVDPTVWGSPVIKQGELITLDKDGEHYAFKVKGKRYSATKEELQSRFDLTWPEVAAADGLPDGWYLAHPGRAQAFPELADFWRRRAVSLGLDKWLSWDFQFDDAIELMMSSRGSVAAWQQCLGKARLSAALCLLAGDGPGVITMPGYLVFETAKELAKLPIPASDWQIIDSPDALTSLKRINLISLTRIRMPVKASKRKVTYGKKLRHRVSTLIVDEGELLANAKSDQSRAIACVSAKKLFILSGTPTGNFPRSLLPLMQAVGGDGTAGQIWGKNHPKLEGHLITNMAFSVRGVESFREAFVTTEWVTREFADEMQEGAKREIPKIANLHLYRKAISPFVLRRLIAEPEVARFIQIPAPSETVTTVDWEPNHLAFYLKTADDFAHWYRSQNSDVRSPNLVALLARINAVVMAGNFPQRGNAVAGLYQGLTGKQALAVQRLTEWTEAGHKNIMFAQNPGTVALIAAELAKSGIESVVLHGGISIANRTALLDENFRYGDVPNLLTTFGVTQAGYNIPQANRVLLIDRDWRHKVEDQSIRRVLRPDQKRTVLVERLHHLGSIDVYQDQMVAFKRDSAQAGLDWAAPTLDDVEFLHLDTILGRFVDDLAKINGLTYHAVRESIKSRKVLQAHVAQSTEVTCE